VAKAARGATRRPHVALDAPLARHHRRHGRLAGRTTQHLHISNDVQDLVLEGVPPPAGHAGVEVQGLGHALWPLFTRQDGGAAPLQVCTLKQAAKAKSKDHTAATFNDDKLTTRLQQ
jgi:hypothetical protein